MVKHTLKILRCEIKGYAKKKGVMKLKQYELNVKNMDISCIKLFMHTANMPKYHGPKCKNGLL